MAKVGCSPDAAAFCAAALLFLSTSQIAMGQNAFLDAARLNDDGGLIDLVGGKAIERIGSTPAKVVIDKVVAIPTVGSRDSIVLRNIGGQAAAIMGWTLVDGSGTEFVLLPSKQCPQYDAIAPADDLKISAEFDDESPDMDPCGFKFNIGFRDVLKLIDAEGNVIQQVEWKKFDRGSALRRQPDGSYAMVPENKPILDLLSSLGSYTFFLDALKVTGLGEALKAASDPDYEGPVVPTPPPPPPLKPFFPAHFGFAVDRTEVAPPPTPPPPPPPPVGIPKRGPFTIFAPNDEAFETLRLSLSGFGQQPFTRKQVLELPEMVDIMKYHIVGGAYTSDFLLNNTEIFTSLGAEVVPFNDPIMTEGKFNLHDSCVDKPTLDLYECDMQKEFGKCFEPFMVSPLAAQWRGGLCERTCERCTCEFGQCAGIQMLDLEATNGVVHTLDRVMFPPPIFKKDPSLFAPEVEQPDAGVMMKDLEGKFKPTLIIGFKPRRQAADNVAGILESELPVNG